MKAVALLGHDARIEALSHLREVIRCISDGSPITGHDNDFDDLKFVMDEARSAPADEWAALADLLRKSPTEEELSAASTFRAEFEEAIDQYLSGPLIVHEREFVPISIEMLTKYEERDLALRGFFGYPYQIPACSDAYVPALREASLLPWTEERSTGILFGLKAARSPEGLVVLRDLLEKIPIGEVELRASVEREIQRFEKRVGGNG